MYDFTLLKKRLKSVPVIHLIPDLTQMGGEERLGIMASFTEKVDHEFVNSYACLFSGAVTSKEAAEQFAAAAHTFRDLEIEDKLGHLVAGKDVTGHKTGLFKRLADSFQMEIVSQGTCTSIIVHFKMPVWERSARQSALHPPIVLDRGSGE